MTAAASAAALKPACAHAGAISQVRAGTASRVQPPPPPPPLQVVRLLGSRRHRLAAPLLQPGCASLASSLWQASTNCPRLSASASSSFSSSLASLEEVGTDSKDTTSRPQNSQRTTTTTNNNNYNNNNNNNNNNHSWGTNEQEGGAGGGMDDQPQRQGQEGQLQAHSAAWGATQRTAAPGAAVPAAAAMGHVLLLSPAREAHASAGVSNARPGRRGGGHVQLGEGACVCVLWV